MPPASSSAAPGQYFGYSLEQLRFCHHLLSAPDTSSVSLEHTDDIAVHRGDGSMLIEQCKSSPKGNAVAPRSIDLWKTFANWAELCSQHGIDPLQCVFRIYVTPVRGGELVEQMAAANSAKDVAKVFKKIKSIANAQAPDVGCGPHLLRFLAAGDELCQKIIERFELKTDDEPRNAIRDRLVATIPVDFIDDLCHAVVGLARGRVDERIEAGEPPIVETASFRKQWQAYLRKHHMGGLLVSKAPQPSVSQISALADLRPIFVRQLQAVKANEEILRLAISGYLRATADKVTWADEGTIVKSSFDQLDDSLAHRFVMVKDEVDDTLSSSSDEARGRALYRRCIASKFSIEEHELFDYFVCGAYNCLADDCRLGWHPNYKELVAG